MCKERIQKGKGEERELDTVGNGRTKNLLVLTGLVLT